MNMRAAITATAIRRPKRFAREPVYEEELAPLHYDASGLLRPGRVLQVEEEPSTLVARYLFPTEKFRGEWRKHWTHLADQFAYAALATFAFGWLWGFLVKHHQAPRPAW